ncbi:hypothetical protein T4D_14355 [Trichinella pseudospiralis]|uniref:Uncharacterized protein n=1 Tax=Trichinella pseudospiralis TaxID=6337 RepID=A0A0V1FQ06_TRIPS|nr:hypothetical protein T4D_14355 [Trichinella pseudospiralis]
MLKPYFNYLQDHIEYVQEYNHMTRIDRINTDDKASEQKSMLSRKTLSTAMQQWIVKSEV